MTDERTGDELPDDALDALRAAFDALPAPSPVRELSQEDGTTRCTVAWMTAAFRALPVPEPRVPALPARVRPDAPAAPVTPLSAARARSRARRVAAAAALFVVSLGLAWLLVDRADSAQAPPTGFAQGPRDAAADPPAASTSPTLVAAAPDRFELTSGPVRLLLFTDVPDPAQEIPR